MTKKLKDMVYVHKMVFIRLKAKYMKGATSNLHGPYFQILLFPLIISKIWKYGPCKSEVAPFSLP